jgi:hypothetical protein
MGSDTAVNALLKLLGGQAGLTLERHAGTQRVRVAAAASTGALPALRTALNTMMDDTTNHAVAYVRDDAWSELGVYRGKRPLPTLSTEVEGGVIAVARELGAGLPAEAGPAQLKAAATFVRGHAQQLNIRNLLAVETLAAETGTAKRSGVAIPLATHELWENYISHKREAAGRGKAFEVPHEEAIATESAIAGNQAPGSRRVAESAYGAADGEGIITVFDYDRDYIVYTTDDKGVQSAERAGKRVVAERRIRGFKAGSAALPEGAAADLTEIIIALARNPLGTGRITGYIGEDEPMLPALAEYLGPAFGSLVIEYTGEGLAAQRARVVREALAEWGAAFKADLKGRGLPEEEPPEDVDVESDPRWSQRLAVHKWYEDAFTRDGLSRRVHVDVDRSQPTRGDEVRAVVTTPDVVATKQQPL